MILGLEKKFIPGKKVFLESASATSSFVVTFEDDFATGYFYALETNPNLKVLDALHIYNVADVIDKNKPSKIQIAWSENGLIASLLINNYCHAIFDFQLKAGYCRNGFPESNREWTNRLLTGELICKIFP